MALHKTTVAAAALATAAGLNAALGLTYDVRQLRESREFGVRLQQWIELLGSRVTLYHMLELANETADAIWFEGKSWSYRAMKMGISRP